MSAESLQMNAQQQRDYVDQLIETMCGNDVHERPRAKEKLMEIVDAADHPSDCASKNGGVCNCGVREATTFKNTDV